MKHFTTTCLAAACVLAITGCSASGGAPTAGANARTCPLSIPEQRRAVADFAAMMPDIAHPRCANCHGGIDVFAPSAKQRHGGGQISMKTIVDTEDADAGLGPVETRHVQNFDNCDYCHQVPGWETPSPPFFFAGRSPVQICRQFKNNSDPDTFRSHVVNDPLVLAGFEGRRGQDLSPEPPPLPHEAFQRAALDWLALASHGNDWKGGFGSECGCVVSVPRLRITDHLSQTSDRSVEQDITYRADVTQKLDGSRDFTGTGTYSGTLVTQKINCHNGLPEDRKEHQLQGFFNATASVSELGKKKMVNYNFDTTDWPLDLTPPFMLGPSPSAADIETAHHLGSVMGLLVEIQGPKTVIHTHKVDDGRSGHMSGCVKSVAHDEDITIEQFVERQTP